MRAPPEASSRQVPVYRRAATTPRAVRALAFDRLPPAVRDRLTRALAHGAPEALLGAPSGLAPFALRASRAAAIAAGLGVLGVFLSDLGELSGARAVQGGWFALVYAVLLATAVLGGAVAVALGRFQRGAPFRSGRYLLSLDMVEAEGGRLRVTSLDTMRAVEVRQRQVAVVFEDGEAAVFPVGKHEDPAALAAQVERSIVAARALVYPADEAKLGRLDPFFEVRVTEDWEAAADAGEPRRSRLGLLAVAVVAAAAPAGYGLLAARNALSDELMFGEARTPRPGGESVADKLCKYARLGSRHAAEAGSLCIDAIGDDHPTLARYQHGGGVVGALADDVIFRRAAADPDQLVRYLEGGGAHVAEADEALFAVAHRMDTLAAYHDYLAVGTLHAVEVRTELVPEADYRQAARSGLVGSLFSFVRRNPGSRHEEEARQRIRQIYAGALDRAAMRRMEAPERSRFAEALLDALLDRADPRVSLDVRMAPATAVDAAEAALIARHGERYLPAAGAFSAERLQSRGRAVHEAVAGWFGETYPNGVAEITRTPAHDDGRPSFEVACEPVVDGTRSFADPGTPPYVTVVVGFRVEVKGLIRRGGKETTVSWKAHLREGLPAGIAATFDERL
jgi:hypothetical protein